MASKETEGPDTDPTGRDEQIARTISHASGNELSFDVVDPVEVQLNALAVSVDTQQPPWSNYVPKRFAPKHAGQRSLLKDVNATIPSGSLTVILGSSGR